MKLFVGLDVSSFDIKVCFLNGEGEKPKSFTTANNLPGATNWETKFFTWSRVRRLTYCR